MAKLARQPWLLGILSALLLLLPFSIIGPVPFWRTFFAWLAFVPLFCGLLSRENLSRPRALLRGALAAYLMGFLWFAGNCYWIYQTMLYFGGLPPSHLGRHSGCLQHGAGALFRRPGPAANRYGKGFPQRPLRTRGRAFFLGSAGTVVGAIYQGSVGSAGIFADRQFSAHQPGSLHRGVWHHLRADRRQCAHRLGGAWPPHRNAVSLS